MSRPFPLNDVRIRRIIMKNGIFVNILNGSSFRVRDYRSAARYLKRRLLISTAFIEFWKNGKVDFAVLFENGIRTSSCFLKE